jgi:cytolysin (calcineurin-like family phosphatase)
MPAFYSRAMSTSRSALLALVAAVALVTCATPEDEGELQLAAVVGVPARLQAEAYERAGEATPATNSGGQCNRGDGVDMETTTDAGGGCNVGWTEPGEWLEFRISSPTTRNVDITARLASDAGGRTVRLELDGAALGSLAAPSGGWQSWQSRTLGNVRLPAGDHVLRVVFDTGNVNLNYVELTAGAATCSDGIRNGSETGVDCGGSCRSCSVTCAEAPLPRTAASASSTENASYPASLAIDGSATTRWSSAYSDPQWIQVDLGAARRVSRVVLSWETAASAAYDVAIADAAGGPFTTIYGSRSGDGGVDDLRNLAATGRYLRVTSHRRTTAWGVSLFDVGVHGDTSPTCGGAPPPPPPTDVTFYVVSDTHADPPQDSYDLRATARAINAVAQNGTWPSSIGGVATSFTGGRIAAPSGVVFLGDITGWGTAPSEIQTFRRYFEQGASDVAIQHRSYVGLGNHDLDSADRPPALADQYRAQYWAYVDGRHKATSAPVPVGRFDAASHAYSWDVAGVHFVQLHRKPGDRNYGLPSSLDFLRQDLAASTGRPVFLFHHYGMDPFGTQDRWWTAAERTEYRSILRGKNVAGVFVGHSHAAFHYTWEGLRVFHTNNAKAEINTGNRDGNGSFSIVRITNDKLDVVTARWLDDTGRYELIAPFYSGPANPGPAN